MDEASGGAGQSSDPALANRTCGCTARHSVLEPSEPMGDLDATAVWAAKDEEFFICEGAPHAFNADYRPSYRKEAAEDGWRRILAFFKRHGMA